MKENHESEVIFNAYCPQTMSAVVWIQFCKESKLFSKKKKFQLPEAHIIFQKAFSNRCESRTSRRTAMLSAISHQTERKMSRILSIKAGQVLFILLCLIRDAASRSCPQKDLSIYILLETIIRNLPRTNTGHMYPKSYMKIHRYLSRRIEI